MDLIIGLAAADEATGGREMRRLADGWMGRESKYQWRLRAAVARALVALAARIDPAGLAGRRDTPALPAQSPG